MGKVDALVVDAFKGIHRPGLTERITTRRKLDEPREMYNFHLTREGHLHMPKAATSIVYDFSASGNIMSMHYTEEPRGYIVQLDNGEIYMIGIDTSTGAPIEPVTPALIATIASGEEQWRIHVLTVRSSYTLISYCPRGSAGPVDDGKTWKVSGSSTSPTVTDITGTVGRSSDQVMYKGRRFWVGRGRTVAYSPLNEPDAASEGSLQISGDDAGTDWVTNPGFVNGMMAWEDILIFFMLGSTWVLTGAGPSTWKLRESQGTAGNNSSETLMPVGQGVLSIGGRNINDPGLYLFSGQSDKKVSDQIDDWMESDGNTRSSILSAGRYIFETSRASADARQFLSYDLRTGEWTAFDGWADGTVAQRDKDILVSLGGVLYLISNEIFPRAPGRGGKIRIGYHDESNPSGLNRYISLKLAGRYWGTGTPSVTVTATTSDGSKVSGPFDIATDVFDNLVIPLNIRGSAIELLIEVTPANDNNEVLFENLQVIVSRKGEKASRG